LASRGPGGPHPECENNGKARFSGRVSEGLCLIVLGLFSLEMKRLSRIVLLKMMRICGRRQVCTRIVSTPTCGYRQTVPDFARPSPFGGGSWCAKQMPAPGQVADSRLGSPLLSRFLVLGPSQSPGSCNLGSGRSRHRSPSRFERTLGASLAGPYPHRARRAAPILSLAAADKVPPPVCFPYEFGLSAASAAFIRSNSCAARSLSFRKCRTTIAMSIKDLLEMRLHRSEETAESRFGAEGSYKTMRRCFTLTFSQVGETRSAFLADPKVPTALAYGRCLVYRTQLAWPLKSPP
jgi:hypothetical protein